MLKYHVAVCDDEKSDLDGIVQSVQQYDVQGCFDIETYMDVAIHSINLILINYALSNMMAFFRSSLLYILFFTSEMWVFVQYRKNIEELSDSKALANLLLIICVAIEIGLLYFFGIVSGELIPFKIKW